MVVAAALCFARRGDSSYIKEQRIDETSGLSEPRHARDSSRAPWIFRSARRLLPLISTTTTPFAATLYSLTMGAVIRQIVSALFGSASSFFFISFRDIYKKCSGNI